MRQTKNHNRERKTILIVDDEESIVHSLSTLAERFGYNSIMAFDGMEAVELFRKNRPDLVATDLIMPKIGGFELVEQIRRIDPLVPIIIMTAYYDPDHNRHLALASGADALLTKPFQVGKLFEEVEALLNKTPLERENDRLKFSNRWLSDELKRTREGETVEANAQKDHAVYATIAHDMTNELSAIGGALRAIRHLTADSDEIREECDLMETSLHYWPASTPFEELQ